MESTLVAREIAMLARAWHIAAFVFASLVLGAAAQDGKKDAPKEAPAETKKPAPEPSKARMQRTRVRAFIGGLKVGTCCGRDSLERRKFLPDASYPACL